MAKKTAKKDSGVGAGAIVAGSLIGLGLITLGAAIGASASSDRKELRRKVRKLDRRTKKLKQMVEDVDERAGHIQVVAPEGTYPAFDQSEDIEA